MSRALHTAKTNDAIATIVETIAQRSIMLSYPVIAGLLVLMEFGGSAYHHRGARLIYYICVLAASAAMSEGTTPSLCHSQLFMREGL